MRVAVALALATTAGLVDATNGTGSGGAGAGPAITAPVVRASRVDDRPPLVLRSIVTGAIAVVGASSALRGHESALAAVQTAASSPLVPEGQALAYSGRNHFWIPALGISRPVVPFPCSRKRAPDNFMYRWGCAGKNNVYILGHASGVMKALHDAYAHHRLSVGMIAMYADGTGHIRVYRVTEWRVVDPVDSNWAVASQPVPSMTLQTCVGPSGRLRLNVRLVAVD